MSSLIINANAWKHESIKKFIRSVINVPYLRINGLMYNELRNMMDFLIRQHYGKGKVKSPKLLINPRTFAKIVDGNGLTVTQTNNLQARVEKDLQKLLPLAFVLTRFAKRKTLYPRNLHTVRRIHPNFVYN